VIFGKTADSVEVLFGMVGRVGPRNDVIDRGPGPPPQQQGADFFRNGVAQCKVYGECGVGCCAKMVEPIELSSGWRVG